MELQLFFDPVTESELPAEYDPHNVYHHIETNYDTFPELEFVDIALIGVSEIRGAGERKGLEMAASEIRKAFYKLKKGTGFYNIVDLGNLRAGVDIDQSYGRLREVCEMLLARNILPVIIGGSHDFMLPQYQAYESLDKLISLVNVDAFIDVETREEQQVNDKSHVHKILLHEPNFLFNYSHIAYQSYLVDNQTPITLEQLYFKNYRLGEVNQDITSMEPVIREADMMGFDISAIKVQEACGQDYGQPFGLTGQEACQLSWYAGLNNNLSSVGFYEYNPEKDDHNFTTARIVATMVWYFVEGYYHRREEQNFKSDHFLCFRVPIKNNPYEIAFYKSKLSERWWMEVPVDDSSNPYKRRTYVPCDYSDYETALNGEIPDRWIHAYAKNS